MGWRAPWDKFNQKQKQSMRKEKKNKTLRNYIIKSLRKNYLSYQK